LNGLFFAGDGDFGAGEQAINVIATQAAKVVENSFIQEGL